MSAWYVLSAMGIYAVTPGLNEWELTTQNFDLIKVTDDKGKIGYLDKYTKTIFLPEFSREEKVNPNGNYMQKIIPVPIINAASKSFKDKLNITFDSQIKDTEYFYSINDSEFKMFDKKLILDKSAIIKFYSDDGFGKVSDTISAQFFKKPNNYTINILPKLDKQYHAGGPDGLLDGIHGDVNWRKGEWQGYQGRDFEAIIDLQKEMKIESVSANFLQDTRAWILMPTYVEFYVSNDNKSFKKVITVKNQFDPKNYEVITQNMKVLIYEHARYVKIIAKNFGKLPKWHQGHPYDGDAYIFIDEITVN